MLFHDPHALNRNSFTWEPDSPHDQWNEWDFALAEARQVIEDYTDEDGLLIWERDSEDTVVKAYWKLNRARAAKERLQKKSKETPVGSSPIVELGLKPGRDWPTLESWWAEEQKKQAKPTG